MSGIFGLTGHNLTNGNEKINKMGQIMAHRPWYQVDTLYNEDSCIGLGRLGIGIFNAEAQPINSEDEHIILFLSGEFYNVTATKLALEKAGYHFRDDSQAEFALRCYQEYGIEFAARLEGIFAIAIWDRNRQLLILVNDRFGYKPVYYTQNKGVFIFAPEIKAILLDTAFHKKLDLTALAEFLRFQQLLGNKTFFEGISLLPPATILTISLETQVVNQYQYWDWRTLQLLSQNLDKQEIFEEANRLFIQAVHSRLGSGFRNGIYLSGGLDSRMILAVAPPESWPINTITYGHKDCRDVEIAARVAKTAGSQHHWVDFKNGNWVKDIADFHLDLIEGGHSWIHAHGLSTLAEARQMMDVNYTGYGAGIMTGIYDLLAKFDPPDQEALVAEAFRHYSQKHSWPGLTEAEALSLYSDSYKPQLVDLAYHSLKNELIKFAHANIRLQSYFFSLFNHDRRMIFNLVLFKNSHIENRIPYHDYQLVEWMANIPISYKTDKSLHRFILDKNAPKLARIPWDRDYRLAIPNGIQYSIHTAGLRVKNALRKHLKLKSTAKHTLYADYENYLRFELREWAENILFDERTLSRGIFRYEALRSLMDRHIAGREEWTIGKISHIITFEMMMRRFFDA